MDVNLSLMVNLSNIFNIVAPIIVYQNRCYYAARGEFLMGIALVFLHRLAIGYKYASLTKSEYHRLLWGAEDCPYHMKARATYPTK